MSRFYCLQIPNYKLWWSFNDPDYKNEIYKISSWQRGVIFGEKSGIFDDIFGIFSIEANEGDIIAVKYFEYKKYWWQERKRIVHKNFYVVEEGRHLDEDSYMHFSGLHLRKISPVLALEFFLNKEKENAPTT